MIFFYIFWGRGGGISLPPCLQLQFQKEKNKEKDFFFGGGGADVNLFSMADFSMFFFTHPQNSYKPIQDEKLTSIGEPYQFSG